MAELVRDTFTRTVSTAAPGTWGAGELGGTWSVYVNSSNVELNVDGSRGRFAYVAGTGGAGNTLLAAAQSALEAHGSIEFRPTGDALGFTIYLWFRAAGAISTFTGYGVRLTRTATTGVVSADLVRGPVDAPVVLAALPAVSWPTFTEYRVLELEVTGANPTTIKARYYPSTSKPTDDTGWTTITDTLGPQAAGVYALRSARTTGNADAHDIVISQVYVAPPLRPAFTASVGSDGLTVTVVSSVLTTGDPTAHAWTFGDGADETLQDTGHTYTLPGTYTVTYTAWTRWGTRRSSSQSVVIPGATVVTDPDTPVRPSVYVGGEDVCDRVYSVAWQNGRSRWPEETNGSSVTINLRGRMSEVNMGTAVVIASPPAAPGGARTLWTGEVDQVTEAVDPVTAKTTTTIVAMDVLAFLSRWHILPGSAFVEGTLPTRLLSLAPRASTSYRAKWAGVPGARWPILKSLAMTADKLRQRTYLDLLRDGLRASLATAYVDPNGVIVYAPLDPPAMPSYSARVLAGTYALVPQSHWKLGETGTTAFADSRPTGYSSTAVGAGIVRGVASLADGDDAGVSGTGGSGSIQFGDIYNKSGTNTWSVGCWLTWDGSGEYSILDKISGPPYLGWRCSVTGGYLRLWTVNTAGTFQTLTGTTLLVAGEKHHVVFTWAAATVDIYLDGVLEATAARTIQPSGSPGRALLANIRGQLDELSIWGAPMGPKNVWNVYHAVPTLDLDSDLDCADHVDVEKSTAEGMVNRWTAGADPPAGIDRVERPSIEAYGESTWSVGTGVLKVDTSFPITDPVAEQLREPFPARSVIVPIRDWSQLAWKAEPLDMASMDGQLFGILGVKHQVNLREWSVELALDRDPWTMTGAVPPTGPPAVHVSTQTFDCSKDALLASPDMGAGAGTRLPVGYYGGTKFRALMQFGLDWAHTPKKIRLAELLLDTAGQDAVGYGSNPQIHIDRVIGSWSEGSYGSQTPPPWVYSTTNAVVYPGPSCTTTGRKSFTISNGTNVALTLPMTQIVQAWADGTTNRGIRIISQDESSSSRTTEFYSSEYSTDSRRPKLRVEYEW